MFYISRYVPSIPTIHVQKGAGVKKMTNIRYGKTQFSFRENLPSNRPNYFFDFPIIGPKIKIVVNLCIWVSKAIRRKIQTQWKKN